MEKRRAAMSAGIVLDASLTAGWCLRDEQSQETEEILDRLGDDLNAIAPALWVWEINNVLLVAERRGRLTSSRRKQLIAILRKLPINIDEDAAEHVWDETSSLAGKYALSVYDAAYLELALRHGFFLGSLDEGLRKAAAKASIKCLPGRL